MLSNSKSFRLSGDQPHAVVSNWVWQGPVLGIGMAIGLVVLFVLRGRRVHSQMPLLPPVATAAAYRNTGQADNSYNGWDSWSDWREDGEVDQDDPMWGGDQRWGRNQWGQGSNQDRRWGNDQGWGRDRAWDNGQRADERWNYGGKWDEDGSWSYDGKGGWDGWLQDDQYGDRSDSGDEYDSEEEQEEEPISIGGWIRLDDGTLLPPWAYGNTDWEDAEPKEGEDEEEEWVKLTPKATVNVVPRDQDESFAELGATPDLIDALSEGGFTSANPIQSGSWAPILGGGDVVMLAETGSGKTLAYLVPMLQRMLKGEQIRLLILQPSKQLSNQVARVLEGLMQALPEDDRWIQVDNVMAYTEYVPEGEPDIVIGTPPYITQYFGDKEIRGFDVAVFDEADHMFEAQRVPTEDVLKLLARKNKKDGTQTQYVLVGATLSGSPGAREENLARTVLKKFPNATWVRGQRLHRISETLTHKFVPCSEENRMEQFMDLMEDVMSKGDSHVLVFACSKANVEAAAEALRNAGHDAQTYHQRSQAKHTRLEAFRSGELPILVASPAAARGIDLAVVNHVICFEFPPNAVEWLHCVGRTARNKVPGWAWTMYLPEEARLAEKIEQMVELDRPVQEAFGRSKNYKIVDKGDINEYRKEKKRRRLVARDKKKRDWLWKNQGYWAVRKENNQREAKARYQWQKKYDQRRKSGKYWPGDEFYREWLEQSGKGRGGKGGGGKGGKGGKGKGGRGKGARRRVPDSDDDDFW